VESVYANAFVISFLADRTASNVIGFWHHKVVGLSVRLSVFNDVYCGAQGRVKSVTVVFLAGNFPFTSSDTFAV